MLLIGIIFSIVGAGLQAGSINYGMFLASRVVLGLGAGATQVSSAPLLAETAYPSQRPAITSMMQASYPAGAFLAALFVYAGFESDLKYNDWSWRMPSVSTGCLSNNSISFGIFLSRITKMAYSSQQRGRGI